MLRNIQKAQPVVHVFLEEIKVFTLDLYWHGVIIKYDVKTKIRTARPQVTVHSSTGQVGRPQTSFWQFFLLVRAAANAHF